jgi:hypothetical protein
MKSLGSPGVDVRLKLKCILKEQRGRLWTGFIWLRMGTNCGLFLTPQKSGLLKRGKFLGYLRHY